MRTSRHNVHRVRDATFCLPKLPCGVVQVVYDRTDLWADVVRDLLAVRSPQKERIAGRSTGVIDDVEFEDCVIPPEQQLMLDRLPGWSDGAVPPASTPDVRGDEIATSHWMLHCTY